MSLIKLLYNTEYKITDDIIIRIPTVGEVLDNEEEYYNMVTLLTAMPIDMIVQLDEIGLDCRKVSEYDLFIILFSMLDNSNTQLIFKNLDIKKFMLAKNESNDAIVLLDKDRDIKIDRGIHSQITTVLRAIHHFKRNNKRPGNDEAYKYLIAKAKRQQQRAVKRAQYSQLESLIVGMVNTSEFKYNFNEVRNLTIYQFNECVSQVSHRIEYNNHMLGIYTGNLDVKKLSQNDLIWLKSNNQGGI